MTPHQYLEGVLDSNKFDFDGDDYKEVVKRRDEIEAKLREEFGAKIQTVKYSGSIAKHTAVKGSYDVDIAVHFKHDSFDTLKGMFEAVQDALKKAYDKDFGVRTQKVSIGIKKLHVDVVPGRRINENDPADNDVNLYRTDTDSRIKTNIVDQVTHLSGSGAREVIRLAKVWRDLWGASFKSFALELLVIEALVGFDGAGLDGKMRQVLTFIKDSVEDVSLPDPGNQSNDVAGTVDSGDKAWLKKTAKKCLAFLETEEAKKEPDMEIAWRKVFKDQNQTENFSKGSHVVVTADKRLHEDRTHG